jgi:hypothetical protein
MFFPGYEDLCCCHIVHQAWMGIDPLSLPFVSPDMFDQAYPRKRVASDSLLTKCIFITCLEF